MSLRRLNKKKGEDVFTISHSRMFSKLGTLKTEYIIASYAFAYAMSFSDEGHHRRKRSGGAKSRKNVEVFCNTFLGKLGEFAVYQYFRENNIEFDYPDVEIMGKGYWDSYDFQYNERRIGIKSTKHYGNLMLLETRDWNERAEYIPNLENDNSKYDDMLFVRMDTQLSNKLKKKKAYYNNKIDILDLHNEIMKDSYNFDIHYVPISLIKEAIKSEITIKKNSYLQSTKIDAENYYIQSGDMSRINVYISQLKSLQ